MYQAAFMTMAFGGPNAYKGKDMAAAHSHLMPHLEESHFNAIVEHFAGTLQDLGVAQEDIDAAVAVVATTKDAVLSRDTAVPAK
jgi:hemoglobin